MKTTIRKRLFLVLFLLPFSNTGAFSQRVLSAPSLTALPGSQVKVPIQLNDGGSISAIQFTLTYAGSILSVSGETSVAKGTLLTDHGVTANTSTPGRIQVTVVSFSVSSLKSGPGTLVEITFGVSSSASGASNLILGEIKASDTEGNPVTVTPSNGQIALGTGPTTTTSTATTTTTTTSTATTSTTRTSTTSTTISTTSTTSSTTSTTLPAYTLFFPQVADGGGYSTKFTFFGVQGRTPITGRLRSYNPDGTSRSLEINGVVDSEFSIIIPTGGSLRLSTSGTEIAALSGWASLESATPVQGLATFDLRHANGNLTTTVAVLGSNAAKKVILPVETSASSDTGVAIVNVGSSSTVVRSRWIDERGVEVASILHSRLNPLGAKKQLSAFASEFFAGVSGVNSFNGTLILEVLGEGQISVTGLIFKEGLFSAIPVVIIE